MIYETTTKGQGVVSDFTFLFSLVFFLFIIDVVSLLAYYGESLPATLNTPKVVPDLYTFISSRMIALCVEHLSQTKWLINGTITELLENLESLR